MYCLQGGSWHLTDRRERISENNGGVHASMELPVRRRMNYPQYENGTVIGRVFCWPFGPDRALLSLFCWWDGCTGRVTRLIRWLRAC